MENYTFLPIGPSPIQDPFQNRLGRAEIWGEGLAAGAIAALEMVQDPLTKDGWLYAGATNGGVWGREYKGGVDSWGDWIWFSGGDDYQGVQSIAVIKTSEDRNWLIAAAGNKSSFGNLGGEISEPLQIAKRLSDGKMTWLPSQVNSGAQEAIRGKSINDLAISKNCLVIATDDGTYISKIDSNGMLTKIIKAAGMPESKTVSICITDSGRIYTATPNEGIFTTTIDQLLAAPNPTWQLVSGTAEVAKTAGVVKLATAKDSRLGVEMLYIGTANSQIETIYAARVPLNGQLKFWSMADVKGKIGSAQAGLHFSFAVDPTNPYSVLAGGNLFNSYYNTSSGGLVATTFPEFNQFGDPTLVEIYGSPQNPNNAGGTAPHADSRAVVFLTTQNGDIRIFEADDGGIYYKDNKISSPWKPFSDGLGTAEGIHTDWSNIGNLAIIALQDNATSVLEFGSAPRWLNVHAGDGAIGRFDDGISGSNGLTRAYYSSQQYNGGSGFNASTYDDQGILISIEYPNLDVLDEWGNFNSFRDHENLLIKEQYKNAWGKSGYPFYSPVETSAYRAGDIVLSGIRNLYEQIIPHWNMPTSGQMYLIPLLADSKNINLEINVGAAWRYFIDLAIGSTQAMSFSREKPYSWDTIYASSIEFDASKRAWTPRFYGRKAGSVSGSDWYQPEIYQLKDLTEYLPKEVFGKAITGVTFNPEKPDQVWATVGTSKSKANQKEYLLAGSVSNDSYIIYSANGGTSWETVAALPQELSDIVYAPPTSFSDSAELFISGYGGIWTSKLDANNHLGELINSKLLNGAQTVSIPKLWISELKYDPVDDVVIANTIGRGALLLNRSGSTVTPTPEAEPGIRLTSVILPQDEGTYRTRKGRDVSSILAATLVRDESNINQSVSADIILPNGWENYLAFPDFYNQGSRPPITNNRIPLKFEPGINSIYIYIEPSPLFERLNHTIPDVQLDLHLGNAIGADIVTAKANVYLYATLETVSLSQAAAGVFNTPNQSLTEIAQQLSILMPRSNLGPGDKLFWYEVGRPNGSIQKSDKTWLLPSDLEYPDLVRKNLKLLATSTLPKDSRAFSPEKAFYAFDNPSIVLESEGIDIGTLTTSSGSGLPEYNGYFALALQDALGNLRLSPLEFSIDSKMDNSAWFGTKNAAGSGQVVLAPGNGDLFFADESYFAMQGLSTASDRISMDLSVARFSDTITGYGIYRVDDPYGAFQLVDNNIKTINPGSLDYAKEAIKRSLSGGLDGITGLTIPAYAQSIKYQLQLATGNAYALYITPGKVISSTDQLTSLSDVLFSVKTANVDNQLKQISMGTGYFAFDDNSPNDGLDFNDMLFNLAPSKIVNQNSANQAIAMGVGASNSSTPGNTANSSASLTSFAPFESTWSGGFDVSFADINGDGVKDYIAAAQPGGGPRLVILDGISKLQVSSFYAFTPTNPSGVNVSSGDLNSDGNVDVVVGTAKGTATGSLVQVWSFDKNAANLAPTLSNEFLAYDSSFSGGVDVATGHFGNWIGYDQRQIVTASGPSTSELIRIYGRNIKSRTYDLLTQFNAYSAAWTGGARIAAGDIDGDGTDDIIVGAKAGGGPHVLVFDGSTLGSSLNSNPTTLASFYAYDSRFAGGVDVSATDISGDGKFEVITGAGPGGGPHVEAWSIAGGLATVVQSFYAQQPDFSGGVFVG